MTQLDESVFGLHDLTNVEKYQAKISKVSVFLGISLERAKRYAIGTDGDVISEARTVLDYLHLSMSRGKLSYGDTIPNAVLISHDLVDLDECLDRILEDSNLVGSVPMVEVLALITYVDCIIKHYNDPGDVTTRANTSLVQHMFTLMYTTMRKYLPSKTG